MRRLKSSLEIDRPGGSDKPAALYVNYFEMGHNPFEFLIDLGQYHPGLGQQEDGATSIHSRIAMAPPYAKMLAELLTRSVREHESEYGEIAAVAPSPGVIEGMLVPLGDFEARARALRAAPPFVHPSSKR